MFEYDSLPINFIERNRSRNMDVNEIRESLRNVRDIFIPVMYLFWINYEPDCF